MSSFSMRSLVIPIGGTLQTSSRSFPITVFLSTSKLSCTISYDTVIRMICLYMSISTN
ncbi:hypothetical protein ID866_9843 [Astraeus odoratus]|nr:hypothetical protein ID866_9843 [Astraeus odoratus]